MMEVIPVAVIFAIISVSWVVGRIHQKKLEKEDEEANRKDALRKQQYSDRYWLEAMEEVEEMMEEWKKGVDQ